MCVQLAARYTPICLAANRCISMASARPSKEHTSLSINYSLYINYTFVKALPKLLHISLSERFQSSIEVLRVDVVFLLNLSYTWVSVYRRYSVNQFIIRHSQARIP